MIRDFWVKNYLSIRDKQELSFVAKGPSSELVTEVADGVFLYKLGILYGSNASGKMECLSSSRAGADGLPSCSFSKSQAMLLASVRMVCMPSLSNFASPLFMP